MEDSRRNATIEDINRLHERIDCGFQQLEDKLTSELHRHEEAIFGNGQPGLKQKVAALETAKRDHDAILEEFRSAAKAGFSKLWTLAAGVALAAASAWFGHVWK